MVILMGRTRLYNSDAEKEAAYRSRIRNKEEELRQLKLSFDNYLDEQVSIEDAERQDRTKCIWDAKVLYSENQVKTNYLKAINHEPLDFGMSYFELYIHISKDGWICMSDNCDIVNYRFEEKCIGCGIKNHTKLPSINSGVTS
jgi:hypothetical protein